MQPSNFIQQQYLTMLRISQVQTKIASNHGLSLNAMWCLLFIEDDKVLTQRDLAQAFGLPKSTIHSITLELVRKNCIDLVPGMNKKEKRLILSSHARALRNVLLEDLNQWEVELSNQHGQKAILEAERCMLAFLSSQKTTSYSK